MIELQSFAEAVPARRLWRNRGAWQHLLRFLAVRFLSCPSHVLDCEGTHGRWQWAMGLRRGLKFKLLNAILKISNYLHVHGALPVNGILAPHIGTVRASLRHQAHDARGANVAIGLRAEHMYMERFNMSMGDVQLLRQTMNDRDAARLNKHKTFEGQFEVYLIRFAIPHQPTVGSDLYEIACSIGRSLPAEHDLFL